MGPCRDDYDVVIIGAGIAAASLAAFLSEETNVLLLEMERQPGYHATGRSAAVFIPGYGNPLMQAMTAASLPFLVCPPESFCEVALLLPRGLLGIARRDQFERMRADITVPTRKWLGPAEALQRCPILRQDYVAAAYEDDLFDIEVDVLHQGFLKKAVRHGASIVTNAEVGMLMREGGRWTVTCPGFSVRSPVVVNAAGAWADLVASRAGLAPLGMVASRRTAILLDSPPGFDSGDWPLVLDADEEFYIKPDAGKLLISPCDDTFSPPCDAQPEELDIAIAADRAMRATSLTINRIGHSWAGLRCFAPDSRPVIGFDPRAPGFFWSAGQGGVGIQTSPAWGAAAAALVTGVGLPDALIERGLTMEILSPQRLLRN